MNKDKLSKVKFDPYARCIPDSTTGNCPCDSGYICEYIGYERILKPKSTDECNKPKLK